MNKENCQCCIHLMFSPISMYNGRSQIMSSWKYHYQLWPGLARVGHCCNIQQDRPSRFGGLGLTGPKLKNNHKVFLFLTQIEFKLQIPWSSRMPRRVSVVHSGECDSQKTTRSQQYKGAKVTTYCSTEKVNVRLFLKSYARIFLFMCSSKQY